jgi:pimeloyl-ACP methyl ester carboxylesterase
LPRTRDLGEVARIFDTLRDPRARTTMSHVARAVVDWRGQVITMRDRAYLTDAVPTCVIWGADDQVLPASHAAGASKVLPRAQVEVISNAGHFPHRDHPDRCAKIIGQFVQRTPPAEFAETQWQSALRRGVGTPPPAADTGLTA